MPAIWSSVTTSRSSRWPLDDWQDYRFRQPTGVVTAPAVYLGSMGVSSDPPVGAVGLAAELASVAEAPASIEERAEACVTLLRRLIPFQAVRIALLDPERRAHVQLTCQGFDDRIRAFMTTREDYDEIELLGMHRSGVPLRLCDLPIPVAEVPSWLELFQPAGFRGGLVAPLFAPDGRHVGLLGLNTDDEAHPTEAARDFVASLLPLLAYAVDPLRSISALARITGDAQAGAVLTRAGATVPIPGMPDHALLGAGSAVLAEVADRIVDGLDYTAFLCPHVDPPACHGYVRVTMLSCHRQPPHYLTAVVMLVPAGELHGLTPLELEILGLLIEDWPHSRIAAALGLSALGVRERIERICTRLGVVTDEVAALRALHEGLYVPSLLGRASG
jgi:DNA-binding CsgD family transcriptional regulator